MNKSNNSSAFLKGVLGLEGLEQNGKTLNDFENESYKEANNNYIDKDEAKILLGNDTEVSNLVSENKEKLKNIPGLRHNLEQLVKYSAEKLTYDSFIKSDNIAYQNAVLMYFQLYHFDTQLSINKKDDLYVFAKLKAMNVLIPSTENHIVSQYTKAINNANVVTKNTDGSISSVSKKIYQLPILAGEPKTSSANGELTRYPLRDAGYISFEFDATKGELKLIPIQPGYVSQGYDSSIKIRALTQSGIDKFVSSKADQSKVKLEKDHFRDFTLDYKQGVLTITYSFADPSPDYSDVGQVRNQKKEKKKQNDIDVTKATWSYTADGRFIHHVKVKDVDDTKPKTDKDLEFDINGKIIDGQKITNNGKMLKNYNSSITTTEDTNETSTLETQRTTVSTTGTTLTEIKNQKNFNIIGDKLPEGRKLNVIESGSGKDTSVDRIQIAKIGATSNGKFNHAIEFQSTTDKPNHHIIFPQLTPTASNGVSTEGDLTERNETSIGFGAESDYKISIVNNTITVTKLNTEKLKKKTQDAIYDKLYKAIQNDKGGSKIQDYYKLGTEKGLNYDKNSFTVEMTRRVESLHSVYEDTKPEEQVLEEAIFKTNVYKDKINSDIRSKVEGQYLEFNSAAELRSKGEKSTAQYLRLKNDNSSDYQLFKVAPGKNDLKITKENDNSNSMIEYLVSRLIIRNAAGQNVTFGNPKVEQDGNKIKINVIEGNNNNSIILSKDAKSKQRGPLKGTQLSLSLYYDYELGEDGSLTLTKGAGNSTIETENKTKEAFQNTLQSRGVTFSSSDSLNYDGNFLILSNGTNTYTMTSTVSYDLSKPFEATKVTKETSTQVFLYIPAYCGPLSNMIELNIDAKNKLESYLSLGNTTNPQSLLEVDNINKTFTIRILGNDEFAKLADDDKYTELKTKQESRKKLNFATSDYATISIFHNKINGIDGVINEEAKAKINGLIKDTLFPNPDSDQKTFKDAILDPTKNYTGTNETVYMKEIQRIIGIDSAFTTTISNEFIESYKTSIQKLSSDLTPTQRSEFLITNKEHGFTFDNNGNISYLGNNTTGVTIDGVSYTIENSNGTRIKKIGTTPSELFVKVVVAAGTTGTGTGALPGGTGALPGGTGALPGGTGALPGGTGALPGGTGALPGGTGALPGGTGALPGGTGALPGGTVVPTVEATESTSLKDTLLTINDGKLEACCGNSIILSVLAYALAYGGVIDQLGLSDQFSSYSSDEDLFNDIKKDSKFLRMIFNHLVFYKPDIAKDILILSSNAALKLSSSKGGNNNPNARHEELPSYDLYTISKFRISSTSLMKSINDNISSNKFGAIANALSKGYNNNNLKISQNLGTYTFCNKVNAAKGKQKADILDIH